MNLWRVQNSTKQLISTHVVIFPQSSSPTLMQRWTVVYLLCLKAKFTRFLSMFCCSLWLDHLQVTLTQPTNNHLTSLSPRFWASLVEDEAGPSRQCESSWPKMMLLFWNFVRIWTRDMKGTAGWCTTWPVILSLKDFQDGRLLANFSESRADPDDKTLGGNRSLFFVIFDIFPVLNLQIILVCIS